MLNNFENFGAKRERVILQGNGGVNKTGKVVYLMMNGKRTGINNLRIRFTTELIWPVTCL